MTKAIAPIERRLLNYTALATYLGISMRQAKELAANGEFVKIRIGARVLFDRADADAFIERAKRAS